MRYPPTAAAKYQMVQSRPRSCDGIEYGRNATPLKIAAPSHNVENLPSAAAMHPWLRGYEEASLKLPELFSIIFALMSRLSFNVWKIPLLLMSSSLRVTEFRGLRQALIHHHFLMQASRAMISWIDLAVIQSPNSSALHNRSLRWLILSFGASSLRVP